MENAEKIVQLFNDGMSEGEIVKQLGLTRHAVRTAIVFEEGRQAGLKEAAAKQKSLEMHPSTGRYAAPPDGPNEELLTVLVDFMRSGKHVPEKELRAKYHVSHNAMYKYRAVAADRLQRSN